MPLDLGQYAVMEYLWTTLEKTPDGKAIVYFPIDVEMLWKMGFVDTEKYSMDQWKLVFEPYKQADGSFRLEKDAFLSLDKYRYKGEIHIPFDAMRINEGLYTDEGLSDLVDASIAPSCNYAPEKLKVFFEAFKDTFRTPDGYIKVDRIAKMQIRALIEKNPSPLRNLELMFDQMIAKGKDVEMGEQVEGARAEMATARAAIEASSFAATPVTKTEAAAKGLKGLEKARKKTSAGAPSDEGVHLKKIRRSRKGMRG